MAAQAIEMLQLHCIEMNKKENNYIIYRYYSLQKFCHNF